MGNLSNGPHEIEGIQYSIIVLVSWKKGSTSRELQNRTLQIEILCIQYQKTTPAKNW
jgi:hypothetical protein